MPIVSKRSGAPAGTFTVTVAEGTFTFDDAANATHDVSVATAADLVQHPYLRYLIGGGGIYVAPPLLQDVFMANGVLSFGDRSAPTPVANVVGGDVRPLDLILMNRGLMDRKLSQDLNTLAQDAWVFNDQFEDAPLDSTVWETAGLPAVSGGVLYGPHVSLRPIQFTKQFRMLARLRWKAGTAANRVMGVVLTTDSAATIIGGGFNNTYGFFFNADPSANGQWFVRVRNSLANLQVTGAQSREWIICVTWDDLYGLGMTARSVDNTEEARVSIAPSDLGGFVPTKIGIVASDDRGAATGSGIGPIGFRASHATISPRTNLEGVGQTTVMGTRGSLGETIRVALPKDYDSRQALPVVLHFHGGGGSAADPGLPGLIDEWQAITSRGCIVVSADDRDSTGSPYGLANDSTMLGVLQGYEWVRDRYNVGPLIITGYSGGGAVAARLATSQQLPQLSGLILGNPVLNFDWIWDAAASGTDQAITDALPYIKAGWGVTGNTRAEWDTKTAPANVFKYPDLKFQGIPTMYITSPQDQSVDETFNGLAMYNRFAALGFPVTHYASTGDHTDPASWPTTAIADFIATVSYTNA